MKHNVLLLLGLLAHAAHAKVLVLDSQANSYFAQDAASVSTQQELQGLVAALTGLVPATHIEQESASQIATLLQPSAFKKPQAHVSLSLSGLTQEDVAKLVGASRQHVAATLEDDQHTGEALAELITGLVSANPDVAVVLLEQLAAQTCQGSACWEQHMPQIAAIIGGEYNGDTKKLTLADSTELDLSQLEDNAFATELLSATAGVQALIKQLQQQTPEDITVMDLAMLSLQGLTDKYGAQSAEGLAAKGALLAVLEGLLKQIEDLFQGDVTMQVALFDKAPAADNVESALAWKTKRHARLLQAVTASSSWPGDQTAQTAAAKLFTTKAAGYGGFILLLYFLTAGLYCMCNMPFKKDTLLYGSKKDA